jgi:gas vesicle protein
MTHRTSNMSMGFLAGVGAGLAAGLLLAPRRGEETRDMLIQKASSARKRLNRTVSEQADKAKDIAEQVKGTADDMAEGASGLEATTTNTRTRR